MTATESDGHDAATRQRNRLVNELKQRGLITTPLVEGAFRSVPRHLFLPGVELDKVYTDEAIVIKRERGIPISSSSQPAIMAIMLEQLELRPGQRVLEIGAASGYNAALMASVVGEHGQVITLDIDDDLVRQAREHLAAAGIERAQVICADGGYGYPDSAPYDRIILTVGAWDIAPAWSEQLKPGGRLVLPLSLRGPQKSIAFDWDGEVLRSVSVKDCGFMLLRGSLAGPEGPVQIGPDAGLYLGVEDRAAVHPDLIYRLLRGSSREYPLGIRVTIGEIFGGLSAWLALHEPGYCRLGAEGDEAPHALVPPLFGWGPSVGTLAVQGDAGLAALMLPPGETPGEPRGNANEAPFDIWIRAFGDETPAAGLREQVLAWDGAGRPDSQRLKIRAYPRGAGVGIAPEQAVIEKRATTLVLEWE